MENVGSMDPTRGQHRRHVHVNRHRVQATRRRRTAQVRVAIGDPGTRKRHVFHVSNDDCSGVHGWYAKNQWDSDDAEKIWSRNLRALKLPRASYGGRETRTEDVKHADQICRQHVFHERIVDWLRATVSTTDLTPCFSSLRTVSSRCREDCLTDFCRRTPLLRGTLIKSSRGRKPASTALLETENPGCKSGDLTPRAPSPRSSNRHCQMSTHHSATSTDKAVSKNTACTSCDLATGLHPAMLNDTDPACLKACLASSWISSDSTRKCHSRARPVPWRRDVILADEMINAWLWLFGKAALSNDGYKRD